MEITMTEDWTRVEALGTAIERMMWKEGSQMGTRERRSQWRLRFWARLIQTTQEPSPFSLTLKKKKKSWGKIGLCYLMLCSCRVLLHSQKPQKREQSDWNDLVFSLLQSSPLIKNVFITREANILPDLVNSTTSLFTSFDPGQTTVWAWISSPTWPHTYLLRGYPFWFLLPKG